MFNAVVDFFNFLINTIGTLINFLIGLLPASPFKYISNSPIAPYLPTINFWVPVAEIIVIVQLWLVSVGLYYIYQIVLRWIKAIN